MTAARLCLNTVAGRRAYAITVISQSLRHVYFRAEEPIPLRRSTLPAGSTGRAPKWAVTKAKRRTT